MNSYRAAIVGLTGMGAGPDRPAPDPVLGRMMPHSHAAAYAALPNVTVIAVCDIVPALLERFQQNWDTVFPEARGYTDYREMLAREQIDLLSVATSDHRHARIVIDGAAAGVKGICCEKPIATTLTEADQMIAACRERGIPLVIEHTRRWWPQFVEARRLLRSGPIGPLKRIMATGGGGRAMLFRNTTHLVDSVCFFAESDPSWVVGELDDPERDYGPHYTGDGGRDASRDPGCSAYVHFQNGVRAFVNASKGIPDSLKIELWGESGCIVVDDVGAEIHRLARYPEVAVTRLHLPLTTRSDNLAAVEEMIGLIEHSGEGTSTGEDGRRTVSILLGILQSNAASSARVDYPIQDR